MKTKKINLRGVHILVIFKKDINLNSILWLMIKSFQ